MNQTDPFEVAGADAKVWVVSGSMRGYPDIDSELDALVISPGVPDEVWVGDSAGTEHAVARWAERHGICVRVFESKAEFGSQCVLERNVRMLEAASSRDAVAIAFPTFCDHTTWAFVQEASVQAVPCVVMRTRGPVNR